MNRYWQAWLLRQSGYHLALWLLSGALLLFTLLVAWGCRDLLAALDASAWQTLVMTWLAALLLVLLVAERGIVYLVRPLRRLARRIAVDCDNRFGVRVHSAARRESERLEDLFLQVLAALEAAGAEREALIAQIRAKEAVRDKLINQLIYAQEEERRYISRELHDETGQAITTLMVSMRVLADAIENDAQRDILLGARELAADTLENIRNLAVDLRPPALDRLGLVAALQKHLVTLRSLHPELQLECCIEGGQIPVVGPAALSLYRIAQESLTNSIRHAAADQIRLLLSIHQNHVLLEIADNGCGFTPKALEEARQQSRMGVYGMTERAQLLGGTFQITSAPGQGTQITVVVPNAEGGNHGDADSSRTSG